MTINRLNVRFSSQALRPQQATTEDALSPRTQPLLPADAAAIETNTDIVYLSDLQPQPVEWLWQHRLAAGALAMLSGEPGSGKTWVALAILLIRHLSKRIAGRPIRRGQASIELSSALRTEFLAGSSLDAQARPALLHIKSNLGPLAPPLDYRINEVGNFQWTGLSSLTPDELLADRPTGAGLPKRKFAAQWLRQYLQDGSQTQGAVETAAQRDGVCIITLRRAKFDLGVRSSKDGKGGAWCWALPPPAEQHAR